MRRESRYLVRLYARRRVDDRIARRIDGWDKIAGGAVSVPNDAPQEDSHASETLDRSRMCSGVGR